MSTPSKGIIPKVEPKNGGWTCPDCGKRWQSAQAYSMHWYRTHGGRITPPSNTRALHGKKKSYYNSKKAAAAYKAKKAQAAQHPSSDLAYRRQKYAEKQLTKSRQVAEPPMLLEECPCCHLPLGPILEGIKQALEERLRRHADKS